MERSDVEWKWDKSFFFNLFFCQIIDSVKRLESIQSMFQLMNSKADISTFVQANDPGAYSSPEKNFQKPEDNQLLVSAHLKEVTSTIRFESTYIDSWSVPIPVN